MFIFVIAGYFLSVILICCGIANTYAVIDTAEKGMGAFLLFNLIATALLPALGGLILFGLVQIAKLLEELVLEKRLTKQNELLASNPPTEKRTKKKAEAPVTYFGNIEESQPTAKNTYTPPAAQQADSSPSNQIPSTQPAVPNSAAVPAPPAPENLSFFHVD